MIRADREVKDRDEILDIIRRCDVVRLAIHDEPFPYVMSMRTNVGLSRRKQAKVS